ncbi:MAG: Swt1 family HEPN domain-containing protein [Chromatiaceae bacterium]|nr:Swt1 family HEPN domain-containing protein [Chromatiaceae bacterium]
MAITNHERVGKSLELLKTGLGPFVERELKARYGEGWAFEAKEVLSDTRLGAGKTESLHDVAALLVIMDRKWSDVFRHILGKTERSLVNEIIAVRNRWAHQEPFSSDDAYRALDSTERLLSAVSAPEGEEVERMKMELLRVRFDEQARFERRKSAGIAIETGVVGTLKPWREVVMPHEDVASGRYQQAEFAADLWQVHLGEGTAEYRDPVEFFRRTFLTDSLKAMLIGALRRLSQGGGDPVVQLQTNFGGGKTHSMLAIYHLFSGVPPTDLSGIDAVLSAAGTSRVPTARRVVLVGNKISPGNPSVKPDGTVVRTLWGELAWQLGGRAAFDRVAADDEKATSPGDVLRELRELFNEYGPCLILVDEWVAYARQLHDQSDLPAGGFETQFSFAQVLTESAKLAKNCLLVISLPASDTSGTSSSDDVEVGGTRGREALDRLRNVVGRVESSWRPASAESAEEGFEIVRRRLFQPLSDPAQFKDRDVVARAFAEFYRTQQAEFPPECREAGYEQRIKAAYPIHPEVFDRLCAAPDGGGDPQPVGEGRPQPADPPGPRRHRRPAGAVGADPLPLGQLGAGDREGRGRPQLPAAQARQRAAQPRQALRLPAGGAHHLHGLGAHPGGRPQGHRGPPGEARLRDARGGPRRLRRRPAAHGGGGHLPLPGRTALLVLDPADGDQARRGPRRAAQARAGQGGPGAGAAPAQGPRARRELPPHPPDAGDRRGRAGRPGRPPGGARDRAPPQQGGQQRRPGGRPGDP